MTNHKNENLNSSANNEPILPRFLEQTYMDVLYAMQVSYMLSVAQNSKPLAAPYNLNQNNCIFEEKYTYAFDTDPCPMYVHV